MPNPSFSAPSTESMSSLLPGFEFTSVVSSNAVGAVYFANQLSLDRQVAIKILAPDPERKGTFENKAHAVAGLNHPNLIAMFDSCRVEGMSYLVMEFVPGKSLARSTKGKSVDFEQAMVLIDGICEGLAYAHDNGVVHGYFNSSNVLLNQQAQPKIGNFGVPHSTQGDPVADTALHFIAPEVLGMSAGVTKQSDVYSVAAAFYELVAGRAHGPDVPPPSKLCGCRPEVDVVLKQATDADPTKRMADVRAFQTALKEASKGRPLEPALEQRASAVAKASERAPSRKKPAKVAKVGFDWKLVRSLMIIVGLLYACNLAWKGLRKARDGREKENREILAKEAATKEKDLAEVAQKKAK
ncbi:MAG: serine/threonine-protein kinase [Akkermansiaceae bacterium]|nr:serine/threonine-protein kinase [Akkermansiaceae bacterium]